MERRELICIGCPMGCPMTVDMEGDEITVKGNHCARGAAYAKKEVTSPTRSVTSSICVDGGVMPVVSVKTKQDVPKGAIWDVMQVIHQTRVKAPVSIGDVLVQDCAGTGGDLVATRNVAAKA